MSEDVCMQHIHGACLGSAIGDAAGAVLEFLGRPVRSKDVSRALALRGGGRWRTLPGQVTDDTELALALAQALSDKKPRDGFPLEAVATSYAAWYRSNPFDMGMTCAAAFREPTAAAMMQSAAKWSASSQANGALMRLVPLVVWARDASEETLVGMAMEDARLSHPNMACQECNAAYSLALAHLLSHPGDAEGAIARAVAWLDTHGTTPAKEWIHATDFETVGTRNIGWVRHAFALAFHHLRLRTPFLEALEHTLALGGDTDTNAAIVGGLAGALHGVGGDAGVPVPMIDAVLACAPDSRPSTYWVQRYGVFFKSLHV